MAVADCTFVRIGDRNTQYRNLDELGLFNYNYDEAGGHRCLSYESSVELDAATKTARAFACIAAIFAGFAMLQIISLHLFLHWKTNLIWKIIRVETSMAMVSTVLVFAGFGTDVCVDDPDTKCLPGPAGVMNAINVLLLAVLSWLCWGMAPPTNPVFEVKLAAAENLDEDVQAIQVTDVDPESSELDGVIPPITAHSAASDEAIYGESNHNYRGLPWTKDFEESNRVPGGEMEKSAVTDPMTLSRADSSKEFNDRRGHITPSTNYGAQEYLTAQFTESERRPHHHHHHKKKNHHRHKYPSTVSE